MLPKQIMVDDSRPDQIARAQQLKRARHLSAVQISLMPHHIVEVVELALVDKQA